MTKEERLEKQRQRLAEMKEREHQLHARGFAFIAGVDEVGRGPLAGPVVTAAVVLPEDFDVLGIDDSKKLSEKRREELYDVITGRALAWGIGMADHQVIDEINILQATKQAMGQAIEEASRMLRERTGGSIDCVLLDAVELPGLQIPQESIVKGDAKVLAIAAASIVAKVTRDRMMVRYAQEYPWYAFEKNKGYGTKDHYAGLREHGPCPIHRRTFLKKMH
ncbi:MAG: ribonuclease HII [Firmicutes bacterium]|nr:ribonuclease HII [Bacillota bacterium]